jgi:hypothetical protein
MSTTPETLVATLTVHLETPMSLRDANDLAALLLEAAHDHGYLDIVDVTSNSQPASRRGVVTVSNDDARRATERWEEIRSGRAGLSRLPGAAARTVIREDLMAAQLLAAHDPFPEWDYRRICSELLPRDGGLMNDWTADQWRPVLDRARELAANRTEET